MILYLVNRWRADAHNYLEEHYRSLACSSSSMRKDMVGLFPTTSGWLYRYRTTKLKKRELQE